MYQLIQLLTEQPNLTQLLLYVYFMKAKQKSVYIGCAHQGMNREQYKMLGSIS